ncbi:MAG TPA: methyltransferase domain-containing protein [Chloroflexia bacterium]|nr:methyltransferase domain-containing protein [Chloroflexia bacterium]
MQRQEFEASLAPRQGDLLSLPFDQYGRMRIAQNVLTTLLETFADVDSGNPNASDTLSGISQDPNESKIQNPKSRILDVGGYPGVLHHFVSPVYFDVHVLDVVPDDGSIPNYTQGSGMDLPYPDHSFDVVTALDTLEHIPNTQREQFLTEMMRVARHACLLVNPVQSVEADVAEETLDEYIRWILDAQQEQLREHRDFGLPDASATSDAFERNGWRTHSFATANVYNWLLMMIAKHYLISLRDDKAAGFERTLDRFYNLTFSDADRSLPAYRGVLVAVRPGLEPALERIQVAYPPVATTDTSNTVRLQLTQVLMTLLDLKTANHEDRLLREQLEARDRHVAAMEQRVAVLDLQLDRANHDLKQLDELQRELSSKELHIANLESRLANELRTKDEHILYLEKLLEGIERGRVLRLTRRISRLIGK